MNKLLILLFLILFYSCASDSQKEDFEKTNFTNDYAISFKYMLPEIPSWSNFSVMGDCKRTESIRFMDYEALSKSFNLNYKQLAHFQHMFNVRLLEQRTMLGVLHLSRKDEEKIFQEVSNKVQGGVTIFYPPDYKRVNIIWIDPVMAEKDGEDKLKKLLRSTRMNSGHPVLLSLCQDYIAMGKWIKSNGFDDMNIKAISTEFFAPYTNKVQRVNSFVLYIKSLFGKHQKLHLYSPITEIPITLFGDFKFHKI